MFKHLNRKNIYIHLLYIIFLIMFNININTYYINILHMHV